MGKSNLNAENAENGFLDISGVKSDPTPNAPERSEMGNDRYDADNGEKCGEGSAKKKSAECVRRGTTEPLRSDGAAVTDMSEKPSAGAPECEDPASDVSETEREDAEFAALIKGRYRDAYRRRTENIIRRRLKGIRAKTDISKCVDPSSEPLSAVIDPENTETGSAMPEKSAYLGCASRTDTARSPEVPALERSTQSLMLQREANKSRPRENGVGGSVGMVTGIRVSALRGSDVLELLRRAENGEKIKFK